MALTDQVSAVKSISSVTVSLMLTQFGQRIGVIRVFFFAAIVLASLLGTGCRSSEASTDMPTNSVSIPTSISVTTEAPAPLSAEELLIAKDQWGKFFKSLKRCEDVAETSCYQNAGTGSLNGSPIAGTLFCDYKEYSAGQYACEWTIDIYKYSAAKWEPLASIQSQLSEMFEEAFFAEMTGDADSELYFSVMYISFTEAEVLRFKDGIWRPANFDGQSVLYMGDFNLKSGKMQSGVSMDMGDSCDYRRWTTLVYSWNQTEFTATDGLDENNKPISLEQALSCN